MQRFATQGFASCRFHDTYQTYPRTSNFRRSVASWNSLGANRASLIVISHRLFSAWSEIFGASQHPLPPGTSSRPRGPSPNAWPGPGLGFTRTHSALRRLAAPGRKSAERGTYPPSSELRYHEAPERGPQDDSRLCPDELRQTERHLAPGQTNGGALSKKLERGECTEPSPAPGLQRGIFEEVHASLEDDLREQKKALAPLGRHSVLGRELVGDLVSMHAESGEGRRDVTEIPAERDAHPQWDIAERSFLLSESTYLEDRIGSIRDRRETEPPGRDH